MAAHHADRLVPAETGRHPSAHQLVQRDRVRLLVGQAQVEVDRVAGERDTGRVLGHLGETDRLPGLGDHRRHQRLVLRLEVVDDTVEDRGALTRRSVRPDPFVEGARRLGDRPADLPDRRDRQLSHDRLVGWVLDRQQLGSLHPAAGDERPPLPQDLARRHRAPTLPPIRMLSPNMTPRSTSCSM
jgi:hypothetical protein